VGGAREIEVGGVWEIEVGGVWEIEGRERPYWLPNSNLVT